MLVPSSHTISPSLCGVELLGHHAYVSCTLLMLSCACCQVIECSSSLCSTLGVGFLTQVVCGILPMMSSKGATLVVVLGQEL
jgi:hypothetical protein